MATRLVFEALSRLFRVVVDASLSRDNRRPSPPLTAFDRQIGASLSAPQSLLGTYLYVPVEVSEDNPGEKHTKPQNVKVIGPARSCRHTSHVGICVLGTVLCCRDARTTNTCNVSSVQTLYRSETRETRQV